MNFDRLMMRIFVGILIFAGILVSVGFVGTFIDQRRNHEAQTACRERGGAVVMLADGEWSCGLREGR